MTTYKTALKLDYSLIGETSRLAVERGLAEADWYQCEVPRQTMRGLLERRDGPALRDTALWVALILGSGYATFLLWGSWWCLAPYLIYSVLYASTSDSRWHESGHGTAFRTDWMNNLLYEISSFMVMRESIVWRWSHTRHHSDTIIVGRDPEIAVPRPANLRAIAMSFFNLSVYPKYFKHIFLHTLGFMTDEEKTYIPEMEFPKIYIRARIYISIYISVVVLAIFHRSFLPLLLVGLTNLFGTWLMVVYGLTQHAGLAENVLDHRLNCRTVYMNPVNRFLYWNMNFHVEHHMFPLVPYHALPRLHQVVKDDCPSPYKSLLSAWREIVPSVLKQVRDPAYHVKRQLPTHKVRRYDILKPESAPDKDGWVGVCSSSKLQRAEVVRFDHSKKTFALYRDEGNNLYATDGMCTHGNTHLADGLVKGTIIECPKHNGRFNLADGSPARAPICRGLATYPVEERSGEIHINIHRPGGVGSREQKTYTFRVVSNRNVATFIKELIVEPVGSGEKIQFSAGDYMQFDIPNYHRIEFKQFDICEPYSQVWESQHLFDFAVRNPEGARRNNYSIASNQDYESFLRFNVRIAFPPPGQDCAPGVGSSYVFSLRPGDLITGIGPVGNFHVKPTKREMVFIGGGAGMAPLRAQLSSLLETERTARKISYWYGARSRQEIFYEDYFNLLAKNHSNFEYHMALSSPLQEDKWEGHHGFIHKVVLEKYLSQHPNPTAIEYYLCGPPMMVSACIKMLAELNVPAINIAYDEF